METINKDVLTNLLIQSAEEGVSNLSLCNKGITEIPGEIARVINLTWLDLSKNKITALPSEIQCLKNLRILFLHENQLTSLPPEIGSLTKLEYLVISDNQISEIPPEIGQLTHLKYVAAYNNKILKLPSEIKYLKKLKILRINNNYLEYLPDEICELDGLIDLVAHGNRIINLPNDIGKLRSLQFLNLENNALKDLPLGVVQLKNLEILNLRDNKIPIPPEILIGKFEDAQLTISYYYNFVLSKQQKTINEVKLIFIGQGSVGKTSLVHQILHKRFNQLQAKTEGISITRWNINGQWGLEKQVATLESDIQIQLNIWDFGGQEIMHSTHQFFLTKRSLYLLVLDSRLTQEENRVEYWLKIIQSFGGESPVLIVGNKIDQHPLDIDRTGLQKKYPNIVGILETSAATGAGIEALKAAITKQVNNLPHVRDLVPETWFTVKTKLEELGRQSNFITHDKYLELCAENEVSDETSQRTLIGFLHDLGVVLHFQDDPRLEALGILNPQWVTNGVYKILNSHVLFQKKGVLTVFMLDEILNLPEYPRGKRLFVVDMMKKFELCYDLESDKTFLVPDLLPKDQPDLRFNGIPAFEYAYPVLPSSVITRFIIRMNQKIDDGFVWRTGVLLKIGENKALIKADIEDRKITIAIDGLEHTRRDALSAIRYQLDEIHASIKGLDPEKRVSIPDTPNAEPLDYDYLLQLERDGFYELPVKDGNRLVKVDVRKLLSGVVSEAERNERNSSVTNIYVAGDIKNSTIVSGDKNDVK